MTELQEESRLVAESTALNAVYHGIVTEQMGHSNAGGCT